jgi:beta-N-acetylhexosaminidase
MRPEWVPGSRSRRRVWMRGALLAGVLLFGLRAAIGSLSLMSPGGAILGWTHLPSTSCTVCSPPAGIGSTNGPLTPAAYAADLVKRLSLDQELGQLLVVQVPGTAAAPDSIQMIQNQSVGGVIFYAYNIQSTAQVQGLTSQLQQSASIPLILSVDQEGGPVNRLLSILGPVPPTSSLTTVAAATERGQQDAYYLHMLGFNLNLAPVLDVVTTNPQLWERTFGSTPTQVTTLAGAYLAGLQQSGLVSGTLKHFPGLGSTTTDPHFGLPILHRSRADWKRIDLEPYRVLIRQQQVRAILVTHELVPAIDPNLPASLSPTLITSVLRQQLGFQGVVIDDSLTMGALIDRWTMTQAAVLAVKAGADMIIGPYSPETVQELKNALQGALSQGTLSRADIDQAVERDLTLKLEMHLIPMPTSSSPLSPPAPANRLPPPTLDRRR